MNQLRWSVLNLLLVSALYTACKSESDNIYDESKLPNLSQKQGLASSSYEIERTGDFYFNIWDGDFVLNLDRMKLESSSKTEPYSGYWYPETNAGLDIDVSGSGLSPLAKWDRAFNTAGAAVSWERTHHHSDVSWAGHCNGFASSSQRHKEPDRSVMRNGIEFTAKDVKALLAEVYMGTKYFFLGGSRCEQVGTIGSNINNRHRSETLGACEDINPGTFHAALANWAGERKHPLIFDRSVNNEVWNYPLFFYSVTKKQEVSEGQALDILRQSNRDSYTINKGAVYFYDINIVVGFANALNQEKILGGVPEKKGETYTYVLELNAEKEIIGGEWYGDSISKHPDFLWVALEPMQGSGTRFNSNPYVDPAEVIRMWAESVGYDPDNPPLGIMEPVDPTLKSWGKFRNFEVAIDGGERGAAYLGKPVMLGIKRLSGFSGELNVFTHLNGVQVNSAVTNRDFDTIRVIVEPQPGINDLKITWQRSDVLVSEESLVFHALP
ncbi:MAG: hypothetical protein KBD78_09355 [Oligoflexales bacterium]|nr:hypothetical protein [Oligoflexales bacterium]